MTVSTIPDVIDHLAGIRQGDAVDRLRTQRAQARLHSQQSYLALFEPEAPPVGEGSRFTAVERFAVASFVTTLYGPADIAAFYAAGLTRKGASPSLREAVTAEAVQSLAPGPYGSYPAGPLTGEDLPGPLYAVSEAGRHALGQRLSAALVHAHLLVLHPRDARAEAVQALLDAGWSATDIVTLSQLVAFLSYQVRVITGLRALAASPASSATAPSLRAEFTV